MKQAKLMLHTGAQSVNREAVMASETPNATKTWQPVPHGLILDQATQVMEANGFDVVGEAHGMGHGGARYFGLIQVAPVQGKLAEDYGLVVGLRNSHDKSFPAGICMGASVFVCDNLSFSAEERMDRKHTRFVLRDLPGL